MDKQILFGLLRHALTTIGGAYLVKYGVDQATLDTVIGAGITLAGAGWSIYDKRAGKD